MHTGAWGSVHYRWVFFGKQQCPSPWQEASFMFVLCCFLADLISWQLLSSEALWGLKGTVARCRPRCFWHLADWFGLWPLSPSLSDVLICCVRQLFRPTWYLKSEMSHLASDLGLSQSSAVRLEHFSVCSGPLGHVAHTTVFSWQCCFFLPKDHLLSVHFIFF